MKQITNPGSMHETGCSGLVYWEDPEGWDGEGGGRQNQKDNNVKRIQPNLAGFEVNGIET